MKSLTTPWLVLLAIATGCAEPEPPRATTPLHEAATGGNLQTVDRLLAVGASANALDEAGRTPLHYAAMSGHGQTSEALLAGGADANIVDDTGKTAEQLARENGHPQTANRIANFGRAPTSSTRSESPRPLTPTVANTERALRPDLKYPNRAAFAAAIGENAIVLSSDNVYLFAPASRKEGADVVFRYLDRAYNALHAIVGHHTDHAMAVYAFPQGHADASGGTSNSVIWYDDTNLRLEEHEEWKTSGVPHVSGYIEEMAHNFVAATHAQFGWESFGWSLAMKVCEEVAPNPIFARSLADTRRVQAETNSRYIANGMVFPADIPANKVDRIHAHLLHQTERAYGASFWRDVFTEIRKEEQRLGDAVSLGDGNASRNERYRITVECISLVVPGFAETLRAAGISTTVAVKSLDPESPAWNRRLQ